MKYKALILDLDGTTVPSIQGFKGKPSEKVRDAIRQLVKRGIHVSIASGRPLDNILPILNELHIKGTVS